MKKILSYLLFSSFMLPVAAQAGGGGDVKELTKVYDAYHGAIKAGDMNKAISLTSAETTKQIRGLLKQFSKGDDPLVMFRSQVPDFYEVQHVDWTKDGKGAQVYMISQYPAMKDIRPKKSAVEAKVSFKQEKGLWKIDVTTVLVELDKLQRPKDLAYNESDMDERRSGSVGGRIVKVEFKPDHTLVVLRVLDEELAVFLPSKQELTKAGVDFDDYAPWKMRQFKGHPHKTDSLKFFATGDGPVD
jgi:hypothetical protein